MDEPRLSRKSVMLPMISALFYPERSWLSSTNPGFWTRSTEPSLGSDGAALAIRIASRRLSCRVSMPSREGEPDPAVAAFLGQQLGQHAPQIPADPCRS